MSLVLIANPTLRNYKLQWLANKLLLNLNSLFFNNKGLIIQIRLSTQSALQPLNN
jgi:hypothetical protein